ncbi:Proofreading thioesterase in enterobactin biosynthesis EntH [Cronobacter malonaticus 681]|nr:Proofreading thioesterase in enterobactin biosynthesis EntH [Cronobacter malonaticus 681]
MSQGQVRGVCQPLHLGRQSQCWEIVIYDEQGRRCSFMTCRSISLISGAKTAR